MTSRNLKLTVEYDGTAYHGWQYQENAPSIQEHLEGAFFNLTGEMLRVIGSGRTDAGVHARGQVVSVKSNCELAPNRILTGLNAYLPADIAVKAVEVVANDFNARFDAKERIYQYTIARSFNALNRNTCWQCFYPMAFSSLEAIAPIILGRHDFGAFCRVEVSSETKICEVRQSFWRESGPFWIYQVSANRFLHGMVRTLVGTMVDVARGKMSKSDFEQIFMSMDRTLAGPAAPARGLVLDEVLYN